MNNRRSIIRLLLAIAALAVANAVLTYCGGVETRLVKRETLVPVSMEVNSVTLHRAGEPLMRLEKVGSEWRLKEPFAAMADSGMAMRLVDALALTPIDDMLSDSELLRIGRNRADFQLDAPRHSVTVSGEDGSVEVTFGALTPAASGVFAAVKGEDAVFVMPTNILTVLSAPTTSYRRRSLFSVSADSIRAFDIKPATGRAFSFTLGEDGWTVDGKPAVSRKIREFLTAVFDARAEEFLWPLGTEGEPESLSAALLSVFGLDHDNALTLTFRGTDGNDRQLSFGKRHGEGSLCALVHGGEAVVTLPAALGDTALAAGRLFTDSRLFPLEMADVTSLTLEDGETVCVLARERGGTWRLDSPISAAADGELTDKLLGRALALTSADLDEGGLKVSVGTNGAAVTVSREKALAGARLDDLRSKTMAEIASNTVRRVVVTGEGRQPIVLTSDRERQGWNVEADSTTAVMRADEKAIGRLLAALNPLTARRIERLHAPSGELGRYGLDAPCLTVAIDRDDDVRRNLLIGAKTSGGRFATIGAVDAVFVLSEEDFAAFSARLVD